MTDEAKAAAGLITGEQLEYVFNALYENAGGLSVDILLKLAGYYKWNTGKLLEAVCFYIIRGSFTGKGAKPLLIINRKCRQASSLLNYYSSEPNSVPTRID